MIADPVALRMGRGDQGAAFGRLDGLSHDEISRAEVVSLERLQDPRRHVGMGAVVE
jgi:hypothetical protein